MDIRRTNTRHYFIDALRVIAIALMFVYHVNMIFVAEWGWHIKDSALSNVLMEINYFLSFFRMPLLFFVSGFISYALIMCMSRMEFIKQRFNRLIIPTIIWTFLIAAPQIYFERRLAGMEAGYFDFYSSFLEFTWYPEGNFHWLHLWFIPYLFVYNVISIPLVNALQKIKTKSDYSHSHSAIVLVSFVLAAVLPYTFMSVKFPTTHDFIHDYARHSLFIPFVIAGVFAYRFQHLLTFIEHNRQRILRLALFTIVFINLVRWNGLEPKNVFEDWLSQPISYVFFVILNINAWLWVLVCLGYGKRYLNKSSELLTYSNKAVFPFYILHQFFIVMIGFYVVQTSDNAAFKYGFILVTAFVLSLLSYHLYIKPFKFVRFCFGSK